MDGFLKTRKHSLEDDLPCEFPPLAKRLKNLHLNDDGSSSTFSDTNNYWGSTSGSGGDEGEGSAVAIALHVNEYNPELGADQNPYYYEKNKMLYELHVERVKRSNQ